MIIHTFNNMTPEIGEGSFVAENAAVIGDVKLGKDCSVWYSAVIRGDENSIVIGDRVNIQDCAVVHVSQDEGCDVVIGDDVVVGHNATVHGAKIGSHVLIGMGATVLDGAVVSDCSMVAAHALVLGKTVIGPYELWGGVPARFIKKLTPESVANNVDRGVEEYVKMAGIYNEIVGQ